MKSDEQQKEEEFAHVVKAYKSTIYSVCYMFSSDKDEVADLFQETLIHLWLGFDKFRGESKLETWIYRVTMNTCISDNRKKKRRGERVPLTMDIDLFADQDDDTLQVKMLYDRIQKLGLADRAIVMLWLNNLSYEDIGQIMGITANNVSVKLVRIREKLKKNN